MNLIKKIFSRIRLIFLNNSSIKNIYLKIYAKSLFGSPEWLIYSELKYGGICINVKRDKVSREDPRSIKQLQKGGMSGGDRMLFHGYAKKYSHYLLPYIHFKKQIILLEIGILKGTGMAIWCELFENGRILGFDIDLNHIKKNKNNLLNLGAFKKNNPELYEFDQFKNNSNYVSQILKGDKIDICIDDGLHSDESIIKTMNSIDSHLSEDFVYIIEDNDKVQNKIRSIYPNYSIDSEGELTIITKKKIGQYD